MAVQHRVNFVVCVVRKQPQVRILQVRPKGYVYNPAHLLHNMNLMPDSMELFA